VAGKKKSQSWECEVGGLKHLQKLLPLLDPLHDVSCARDRAGYRPLHFGPHSLLILLLLFNPVSTSPRGSSQTGKLRLQGISHTLALVDATLVSTLPRIMRASCRKGPDQSGMVTWRLHTQFDVMRHLPDRIEVTPNGGGDPIERAIHRRMIRSDRLDVMDRGDAKFTLFVR
jgi:hypothetical protein